jgi:hypothetical protein
MFEIFHETAFWSEFLEIFQTSGVPDVDSGNKELEISPKFLDQFLISSPLIF